VILKTPIANLVKLRAQNQSLSAMQGGQVETHTLEVLIPPQSAFIDKTLAHLDLQKNYAIYPIALHRSNQNMSANFLKLPLKVGDSLLIEGSDQATTTLLENYRLIQLNKIKRQLYKPSKAPIAIMAFIAMIALAALGIAPLFVLGFMAVLLVLLTKVIDANEAFSAIDGGLLALIFGMLGVGMGLQESGAILLIIDALLPYLSLLSPFLLLWAIYLFTSLLTEMISNSAVGVLMTPIVISLADSLAIDPRGLVIAVMFAASASFATPIGYQTNTLVYGPGGYKFSDFIKIGLPLNIGFGVIASAMIMIFWLL